MNNAAKQDRVFPLNFYVFLFAPRTFIPDQNFLAILTKSGENKELQHSRLPIIALFESMWKVWFIRKWEVPTAARRKYHSTAAHNG